LELRTRRSVGSSSFDAMVANKRKIIERLRAKGVEVYSVKAPQSMGILERTDLHAESSHIPYSPTWHLNAAGYAFVVRRTLPAIETLVRKVERRG
jgi:hypothetical protein